MNRLTYPTVNVFFAEFISAMKLGSFTRVVVTLGPDFQKVVTKNHNMMNPNIPKTIW